MRALVPLATLAWLLGVGLASGQNAPPKAQLDGTWEIVACIDDGKVIAPKQIQEQFLLDRQLTIQGQTIQVTQPFGMRKKTLAFVTDTTSTPATFDLAGAEKTGSKGIFMLSGDTLFLCLATPESAERPRTFGSMPGSKSMLLTLQRLEPPQIAKIPPPNSTPQPAKPATPAAVSLSPESDQRKLLFGTWGHQDKESVDMITLNSDGSLSAEKTWKSGLKRAFHDDVRSSGNWKIQNGVIIVQITTSTDDNLRGQVYSYRIQTLSSTEVVYVDQRGQMRREWKVR